MFLIIKPTEKSVRQFLEAQKDKPFSYSEVGITRDGNAPNNYSVDHNQIKLGTGRATFIRAIQAVRNWKMFDLEWTQIYFDDTPLEVGRTAAILIKHFGFWSLNAAKIVYILDEKTELIERFGFAYGTLEEHGERGEERFSIEFNKRDESVFYDLYAFSQPNHFMAKLGYPLTRYLQKQFAIESKAAMQRAVGK